ncbi:uncharacterized protein LOC119444831 [Dermacentor silvarum]|uniref:uncharacterized protein LOC119444831 n=1 Tax=Dermacentor silvarum TaxID=543639 RepID=UPI0021008C83|nr:uncharacterized protein LOC119444831 [Dermacentor silvarum]XP_049519646.1 uncharacterized protein LOC119444831 [Dermacentor silvarum]
MRAPAQRKIPQQRRRRKMLSRKLMPRLRRALQAGRVVKPLRDPHPWTVTPMEPSAVGTLSVTSRSNASVSARAARQGSLFPTASGGESGEKTTMDGDFEEGRDVSEDGQEWSDGLSRQEKRKERRRTPVARSIQPAFEEYESSEGGDDSSNSDGDSEDAALEGASSDEDVPGSGDSSTSCESDNADVCSQREVHRLLLQSQNLLQDYEDGSQEGSVDEQVNSEEDNRNNNTFRVFMAADRVVVVIRHPAAVRLTGRAQLRVLHGIVDIEGHVVIGGPVAARIRPDSCIIHSGFPQGSAHVRPLPLEVPRGGGKATHLRRTLARLGMDDAWTQLRPLLAHGTAVMLLEKVRQRGRRAHTFVNGDG